MGCEYSSAWGHSFCSLCGLQVPCSLMEDVLVWGNMDSYSTAVAFSFAFTVAHLAEIGNPNSGRH